MSQPKACEYKTGKILGQGSYATVREASKVYFVNQAFQSFRTVRDETDFKDFNEWKRRPDLERN
jgi:hypothetical protein